MMSAETSNRQRGSSVGDDWKQADRPSLSLKLVIAGGAILLVFVLFFYSVDSRGAMPVDFDTGQLLKCQI